MTYGRYLCSIDKLSSPCFAIFIFFLQLQYLFLFLKSFRSCVFLLSTPFHFRHLSFNSFMKEAISSQNITDPIDFST
jgi:hypothetical protein